jgi:hypothetical protein
MQTEDAVTGRKSKLDASRSPSRVLSDREVLLVVERLEFISRLSVPDLEMQIARSLEPRLAIARQPISARSGKLSNRVSVDLG